MRKFWNWLDPILCFVALLFALLMVVVGRISTVDHRCMALGYSEGKVSGVWAGYCTRLVHGTTEVHELP